MTTWSRKIAIEGLRWVLGLVVLWQSCLFLRATLAAVPRAGAGHMGTHHWIRLALASVEIVAAVMFLAPVVNAAGSYLLLTVFAFAILFHVLQGQFDIGFLLVYAMAVLVWMAQRKEAQTGVRDES